MIFVDSGAWYALMDTEDPRHKEAKATHQRVRRGEYGRPVSSDYVLDETITLLRTRAGLELVREFLAVLEKTKHLERLWVSESDLQRAVDRLLSRPDKLWSFTDCTSFVLMESLNIRDAFSFDENYRQAGFRVLP